MKEKKERFLTLVLRLSVLLLAVMIFSSCAKPPIKMDDIQTVEHGIDYGRFKSLIQRKPTSSFSIQHKDLAYAVEIYPMQTGTSTQYTYVYSPYGGYVVPYTVPVSEDYVFIFHNDHLIYWGFLNECHKADEELGRQLASLISEECEK